MEMIREVGANTIRLAHYQHDQYFYDLCGCFAMCPHWHPVAHITDLAECG